MPGSTAQRTSSFGARLAARRPASDRLESVGRSRLDATRTCTSPATGYGRPLMVVSHRRRENRLTRCRWFGKGRSAARIGRDPERKAAVERRNPVGVRLSTNGRFGRGATAAQPGVSRPSGRSCSERSPPAGLGVLGRNWQPRLEFCGNLRPDLARRAGPVFAGRFRRAAFQSRRRTSSCRGCGGETMRCTNLSPEGEWTLSSRRLCRRLPLTFPTVTAIASSS